MAYLHDGTPLGPEAEAQAPAAVPMMVYHQQFVRTSNRANEVREQMRGLQDSVEKEVKHKHEYLSIQITFYEGIMNAVTIQQTVMMQRLANGGYTPGEQALQNLIYREMTEVMSTLEEGFQRVQGMPTEWYLQMYKQVQAFVDAHPNLVNGLAIGLPSAGAAFVAACNHGMGYCVLHDVLVKIGLLAGKCACAKASLLTSAAYGGVVDLVVAGLIYGCFKLYKRRYHKPEELDAMERRQKEELERMVAAVKEFPTHQVVEGFRKLRELCNDTFCKPAFAPAVEDECLICFRPFSELPEGTAPERAVNCQGSHFMHPECFREWQTASRSLTCPTCGV